MELKIKNEKVKKDECTFWLEKDEDDMTIKSSKDTETLIEFRIKPDGSWYKCSGGNLNNKEK